MAKFKADRKDQMMLLPPAVDDFVSDRHLARFISTMVDGLDTKTIEDKYSELGQKSYDPKILLKVIIYGYCIGIRSGRKIASHCETDLAFMYLVQMYRPDFRTVNDFRKMNLKDIETYFIDTIRMAQGLGMANMGVVAIDGSKFKANAAARLSKDKESYQRWLGHIKDSIKDILAEAQEIDEAEDELYGDERGDELPAELDTAEKLKAKIEEVLRGFGDDEQDKGEADKGKKTKKVNLTDPDANFMKSPVNSIRPGYNCQLGVTDDQVIIAADVIDEANDYHALIDMIELIEENAGCTPDSLVADCGYGCHDNYEYLENRGLKALIPDKLYAKDNAANERDKYDRFSKNAFVFDEDDDCYVCPEGKRLRRSHQIKRTLSESETIQIVYRCRDCQECASRPECTGKRNRTISHDHRYHLIKEMRARLDSLSGAALYQKRMSIIEPIFGHLKHNLGYVQFLLRGLEKVKGEFKLMCIAHNTTKIWRYCQANC